MEKRYTSKTLIGVVGVESSGKSTIASELGEFYGESVVEEYAVTYLSQLNRSYNRQDLFEIAVGQLKLEEKAKERSKRHVICDTTLLVIIVWSLYKYGVCNQALIGLYKQRKYDLIFLTDWNIPWENDTFRENPSRTDRQAIHQLYIQTLESFNQPFVLLSGSKKERFEIAKSKINSL